MGDETRWATPDYEEPTGLGGWLMSKDRGLDWHAFLDDQARRLGPLRSELLRRVHIGRCGRVLEIGCGGGGVTRDLRRRAPGLVVASDRDTEALRVCRGAVPEAACACAEGEALPFRDATFDVVAFAMTLLWAGDAETFVSEAVRVIAPRGAVVALGEPDYRGWIEEPVILGDAVGEGLVAEGADPNIGARLIGLFESRGLRCEGGVAAARLSAEERAEPDGLLAVLESSLGRQLGAEEAERRVAGVGEAKARGERVAFVPVFWAIGRKV